MGITGPLIGAIIGGIIADRVGRRKALVAMVLIFAATSLGNVHLRKAERIALQCPFAVSSTIDGI